MYKNENINDISGIQLFTLMNLLDDFEKTIKKIRDTGFKNIELFGPYPFSSDETKEEWNKYKEMFGLKKDDIYDGLNSKEIFNLIENYGLNVPSIHVDLKTIRNNFNELLNQVVYFKTKYIVLPAIMEPPNSIDEYKRYSEEFNDIGKKLSEINIKFVYHNHGYEHKEIDGIEPMKILMDYTNPEYVKFELDVFWMNAASKDPIIYLKNYKERFKLMHLKDASEKFVFSNHGQSPEEWMMGFPYVADPGKGILPLKEYINIGLSNGVEYFMIEKDLSQNPIKTLENSYKFLNNL